MKEAYFTPESIEETAVQMLAELFGYSPRGRRGADQRPNLRVGSVALLVLDMQDYFLEPESHAFVPSAPAILPRIQALATAFEARGLPLFFTQHVNTPEDAGSMGRWWRQVLSADNPLSRINAALGSFNGTLIQKTQYDAFYKTDLEARLQERGVEQVVVTGVMTHLCCETTARSAFMRGFGVFFTVDGTATYNRALHVGTLRGLTHGFAEPVLAAEILAALRSTNGE
jgi:isochorismate hydrolase